MARSRRACRRGRGGESIRQTCTWVRDVSYSASTLRSAVLRSSCRGSFSSRRSVAMAPPGLRSVRETLTVSSSALPWGYGPGLGPTAARSAAGSSVSSWSCRSFHSDDTGTLPQADSSTRAKKHEKARRKAKGRRGVGKKSMVVNFCLTVYYYCFTEKFTNHDATFTPIGIFCSQPLVSPPGLGPSRGQLGVCPGIAGVVDGALGGHRA